jgi:hypothetical protein
MRAPARNRGCRPGAGRDGSRGKEPTPPWPRVGRRRRRQVPECGFPHPAGDIRRSRAIDHRGPALGRVLALKIGDCPSSISSIRPSSIRLLLMSPRGRSACGAATTVTTTSTTSRSVTWPSRSWPTPATDQRPSCHRPACRTEPACSPKWHADANCRRHGTQRAAVGMATSGLPSAGHRTGATSSATFVPSCLRAFVPSCLRAFVPSCLGAFFPTADTSRSAHPRPECGLPSFAATAPWSAPVAGRARCLVRRA